MPQAEKNDMREFNTRGPCDPNLHYTVMREELVEKGREKVEKGCYFTIFAPRQTGKTTFFQLLMQELEASHTPIWITFENLATVPEELTDSESIACRMLSAALLTREQISQTTRVPLERLGQLAAIMDAKYRHPEWGLPPYASGCDSLFLHDGSLTVPNCKAAPDGVFKNQGNPQPDAYGDSPGRPARFQPVQNSERRSRVGGGCCHPTGLLPIHAPP